MTSVLVAPDRLRARALRGGDRWVLVAGGFHTRGGMDKANAALAEYLLARGAEVHLVAHEVDAAFREREGAVTHLVPRPAGSVFLAGPLLARAGLEVARRVCAADPSARVVANGGNLAWPDVNWVHSVHAAWPCSDRGAPAWFKAKNRVVKALARRDERLALRAARCVIANSERTRRDVERIGVDGARVHTVYLGADPALGPATPEDRRRARAWLGITDERPVVAFVGALSHDHNKGFDVLWEAWRALCGEPAWDAVLVAAGGGSATDGWRARTRRAGLEARVRLLGFTERVPDLIAAADLLVSPVRYEAYGLNVQEALCRGVPVLASSRAGIVERFPADVADMMLANPESVTELVAGLRRWRADVAGWRARAGALGAALRGYTWHDMAGRIAEVADAAAPHAAAGEAA